MAGPSRPVITLNKAMTHTQVYILSRLTVSRDHTRKQIYPNETSPHPPPQDINISATWLLHQRSLISNPPPPPPDNFPLMTTALKDLTQKVARLWVVNLILRVVSSLRHLDWLVCWSLKVPATYLCISGTDLLRQVSMLPH